LTVSVNLANGDACQDAIDRHVEHFGRVDVLVNNAGLGLAGAIADLSEAKLDLHLNLNLRSTYLMMQGCIPALREAGAEHGKALIANISSIFGALPRGGVAAYSMTKAAVIALSQAAHGELSEHGIQVSAICPGLVHTPGAEWMAKDPNDMLRASDVAEVVRMLLRTSPHCVVPEITLTTPGPDVHHVALPYFRWEPTVGGDTR
jgi:NAD(P)-dependent dehydrogenase (short-subunit alcohol dehydrogenase family)